MEYLFKGHYRRQMTKLMKKIIDFASRDGHPPMEATTREANFKKQMMYIRGAANSWDDLTDKCAYGTDPPDVMIKQVLDMMCESRLPLGVIDVLCTCTYVADVCTELVKKSKEEEYDINDDDESDAVQIIEMDVAIGEIVEMYVDYILDKNMMACRDFLFWLDYQ